MSQRGVPLCISPVLKSMFREFDQRGDIKHKTQSSKLFSRHSLYLNQTVGRKVKPMTDHKL